VDGVSRDAAVRAAAEALRDYGWMCDPYGHEDGPQEAGRCHACDALLRESAECAVDAAEPHLTANLARERDEALSRANEAARLSAEARDEAADAERRWQSHQDVCVMATLDRENLETERDEALAALTELRPLADAMLCGEADVLRHERNEALAEVERLREGMRLHGHTEGMPCHHLHSRCFPTDESLREYRVRQREHGAREATARAEEAEAAIARVEALFAEWTSRQTNDDTWQMYEELRAALRGDQP
jgi:hypothetical protein